MEFIDCGESHFENSSFVSEVDIKQEFEGTGDEDQLSETHAARDIKQEIVIVPLELPTPTDIQPGVYLEERVDIKQEFEETGEEDQLSEAHAVQDIKQEIMIEPVELQPSAGVHPSVYLKERVEIKQELEETREDDLLSEAHAAQNIKQEIVIVPVELPTPTDVQPGVYLEERHDVKLSSDEGSSSSETNAKKPTKRIRLRENLEDYRATDKDGRSGYECPKCKKIYYYKQYFRIHKNKRCGFKKKSTPFTYYSCDRCGKLIQYDYDVNFHMERHKKLIYCENCQGNSSLDTKETLLNKKNDSVHPITTNFKNQEEIICAETNSSEIPSKNGNRNGETSVDSNSTVQNVIPIACFEKPMPDDDTRKYSCCFCYKFYGSRTGLRQHINTQHTKYVKDDFKCNICKESFTTYLKLGGHLCSGSLGVIKSASKNS